jgi:hypothetical protein
MSNYEGAGGAKSKGGDNAKALSRPMGYRATMNATSSKTRSSYHASSVNYHYKSCGEHSGNDNLVGYGSGNSSS